MIRSWSFSSLKDFEACPLRLKYKKVDRIPTPPLPPDNPMERGSRIHKEIEDYLIKGTEIHTPIKYDGLWIENAREAVLAGTGYSELKYAINCDWELVEWNDPTVWMRAVLDVVIEEPFQITVVDWKTGKSAFKEVPHIQQAQLYACLAFIAYPTTEKVRTIFCYIDENKDVSRVYNRAQAKVIQVAYHNRGLKMTEATEFPPKPNKMNCKYCDYGALVGIGHCQYDTYSAAPLLPDIGKHKHPGTHPRKWNSAREQLIQEPDGQ